MTFQETDALAKTNRINMLFDFYEPLLTEKQQTFLKYYFHDDYTLSEIAGEFDISRQAVYEHIKRAESALEDYESKLGLLVKHEAVERLLEKLTGCANDLADNDMLRAALLQIAEGLRETEQA